MMCNPGSTTRTYHPIRIYSTSSGRRLRSLVVLVSLAAALTVPPALSVYATDRLQTPEPSVALQLDDVDCGTDLGCLADQAPDCVAATVSYNLTLDVAVLMGLKQGVVSSVTDGIRIQPDPDGSEACQFSLVVQRVDNRLLPEAMQALKDRGVSQADIEQTQNRMAASANGLAGRSGTCLFAGDELSAMLHKWGNGSMSTRDFDAGTCQGSYFRG